MGRCINVMEKKSKADSIRAPAVFSSNDLVKRFEKQKN